MVIASCTILGSFTMAVTPTTAGAQAPSVEVTTAGPTGTLKAGESVEYTFTVKNTGSQELTNVEVTNTLVTDPTCDSTTLAPGASTDCTGSYTITADDMSAGKLESTAKVTAATATCAAEALTPRPGVFGVHGFSDGATGWEWNVDYADASGTVVATIATRTKSDGVEAMAASGLENNTFIFQYNDPSTDDARKPIEIMLAVSDGAKLDAGTLTLDGRGATNLASLIADNNATSVSTMTAGKASGPVLVVEDDPSEITTDEAGTDTAPNTGATLVSGTRYYLGDDQILVDEAPAFRLEYAFSAMAAGETATFGLDKYGSSLGLENNQWTASLMGCASAGSTVSDSDTKITVLGESGLKVTKNQPTGTLAVGEKITYTIDVTNTGTAAIADLVLSDALTNDADESCAKTTLNPDESMKCTATYTITQADVDRGRIDNTASVAGKLADGSPISDEDTVSTTLSNSAITALTVRKVGVVIDTDGDGRYEVGETIKYTITAINNGGVVLSDMTIDDPLTTDEVCPSATLQPGTSMACTATHAMTQADIDAGVVRNSVTLRAKDPTGKEIVGVGATSNVLNTSSGIQIEKGQPTGDRVAGATLTYPITVTNTGTLVVADIQVTDSLVGKVVCDHQALSPQAVTNCTAKYVVTAQDVAAGQVVNTVTVVARDSAGAEVAAADFVKTLIARPSVTPTPTPTPTLTATSSPVAVTPTPTSGVGLAVTGARSGPPAAAAFGLIAMGLILVAISRRSHKSPW